MVGNRLQRPGQDDQPGAKQSGHDRDGQGTAGGGRRAGLKNGNSTGGDGQGEAQDTASSIQLLRCEVKFGPDPGDEMAGQEQGSGTLPGVFEHGGELHIPAGIGEDDENDRRGLIPG